MAVPLCSRKTCYGMCIGRIKYLVSVLASTKMQVLFLYCCGESTASLEKRKSVLVFMRRPVVVLAGSNVARVEMTVIDGCPRAKQCAESLRRTHWRAVNPKSANCYVATPELRPSAQI